MKKNTIEDRLVDFSVLIINLSDDIHNSKAGNHLRGQIIRSGTSVALNYGEAQGGGSKRDFVHKLKLVLKELRETYVCLKIIEKSNLITEADKLKTAKNENDELIAIFVKSIITASKNLS